MYLYHMTDIIPLLGLPYPSKEGMGSYYVPCPCCDTGKGRHLNINLRKDVFRCPVCDFHGGVFDLYAYFKNIPRSEVYAELKRTLEAKDVKPVAIDWSVSLPSSKDQECPLTDIDIRHKTYSALLDRLQLADDHRKNLLGRGLTPEVIQKNGYKTTILYGSSVVAQKLHSEGHYLRGVPGFYKTKVGEWSFVKTGRGFLIPVRDLHGRIQGIQLRLDNVEKRKYRWVSSSERPDGTGAKGWVHLAGPVRKRMILIEGGLKADIVHHLSGQSLIAVPGVNALSELRQTLLECRDSGLEHLDIGFDMDYLRKYSVYGAYLKMSEMIQELGFSCKTRLWNPIYNGMDDYYMHISRL